MTEFYYQHFFFLDTAYKAKKIRLGTIFTYQQYVKPELVNYYDY